MESLEQVLVRRAAEQPGREAFLFLRDGEGPAESLTYGELDRRARAVAVRLAETLGRGERALLLYPPGLDFAVAFFGCLYARLVAVPAPPPDPSRLARTLPRLESILGDAKPAVVLTTAELAASHDAVAAATTHELPPWIATDEVDLGRASTWSSPGPLDDEALVYLQFTSGSTSAPKGVMGTHGNLLHNCRAMREAWGYTPRSVAVIWVPNFHDDGLVHGTVLPVFAGHRCVLMPPLAVVRQPERWLRAISRFRATHSGGPNFIYSLAARKVRPEACRNVDLASWRMAYNAAEPVRYETLAAFHRAFSRHGFRWDSFYPAYGLAETTLLLSTRARDAEPALLDVDRAALERGRVVERSATEAAGQTLVSSGRPIAGTEVRIVDPETRRPCRDGEVGEIWVANPSVARGYWQREEATEETFGARTEGDPSAGPFLRTGDLGFLAGGEVFVTGRFKDLILVRGRNVYPQDVEATVEASHPLLRPGCSAAFSVEAEDEERLAVIAEIGRTEDGPAVAEVVTAVRRAVTERHELPLQAVALLAPGSVLKTSSGKIRRRACRQAFLEQSLRPIVRWSVGEGLSVVGEKSPPAPPFPKGGSSLLASPRQTARTEPGYGEVAARSEARRQDPPFGKGGAGGDFSPSAMSPENLPSYLRDLLSRELGLQPAEIDPAEAPRTYGIDSLKDVELTNRVRDDLGLELEPASFLAAGSLGDLAERLAAADSETPRIPRQPRREGGSPLSPAQERLWFLDRLMPGNPHYNVPFFLGFSGPLSPAVLAAVLGELVRRHETLRTVFTERAGKPLQTVRRWSPVRALPQVDLGNLDPGRRNREVRRLARGEAARPFDLGTGPLWRAPLLRLGEGEHFLLLVFHHIAVDGASLGVLYRELGTLYETFRAGRASSLPRPEVRYSDYAAWQRGRLSGKRSERLFSGWREELRDLPVLELPTDRPRPAVKGFRSESFAVALGAETSRVLIELGRRRQATPAMTLLAAFSVLLARTAGQRKVVVGSPVANRGAREVEELVGCFVNSLPVPLEVPGDSSVRELLGRARERALASWARQELPFEVLVEKLGLARDLSRNPLFQVILVLQNVPLDPLELGGLTVEPRLAAHQPARFDLEMHFWDLPKGFSGFCSYDGDLFDATTVSRLARRFAVLAAGMAEDPDHRVSELPWLAAAERHQILKEYDDAPPVAAGESTIFELFAARAARGPEAVALLGEAETWSYGELAGRARRLARVLTARFAVGPEVRVGLFMERSPETVATILGILAAGGAYVPLDPSYPAERLAYILEDSGVAVLLTEEKLLERLPESAVPRLCLGGEAESRGRLAGVRPENLAYVIYTSGSTGKPKGVGISHANVTRLFSATASWFRFGPDDVRALFHSVAFDVSVWEIFGALFHGSRLVIVPWETSRSPELFYELLRSRRVTVLDQTPSAFEALLRECGEKPPPPALRTVVFAGEALDPRRLAPWSTGKSTRPRWVNMYGITETTVHVTFRPLADADLEGRGSPIGRPIPDLGTVLLRGGRDPVPLGVPGEIFVGGAGLARGYLGRGGLTAERFVPDPFAAAPGARLYKSGDLARRRPDGDLDYLGRADHQVKIRGYRLELGEVEAVLGRHPAVREVCVTVEVAPLLGARLVAFTAGTGAEPRELREHLRRSLPEYMVPALFVELEALPRLPNGKLDRSRLPAPRDGQRRGATLPESRAEAAVAAVWCEVLGLEQVGTEENFFDLGGHSLALLEVRSRLLELAAEAGREPPTVVDLFRLPTIRGLVDHFFPTSAPSPAVPRPAPHRDRDEAVAIVGMAGRFPGAGSVEELWTNLAAGVESISFFSDDELEGPLPAELDDPRYVKAGGVVDGVELFDAAFFDVVPREAELLDPQQRLFLECAWEALERAACDPRRYAGRIGVFAGSGINTYLLRHLLTHPELARSLGLDLVVASDKDFLATRVSYKLDLKGPSMTVQTACSTSLVAVATACEHLRAGRCEAALAGGVTLRLPQRRGHLHQPGMIASPDGHTRAFDARGRGTVGGNGVGVVVLKRLADAVADGDPIQAVIRGVGMNNDGAVKVGYTAPGVEGQCAAVREALERAGVDPRTVGYVEAHGTGTELGDPIEIAALGSAFGCSERGFCAVGSVKTNLGHLDAAAGVTGLVKASLALRHRAIPPSLHFEEPNPRIDFAGSPFFVNTELREWPAPAPGVPRRAGVSSFGIGGTNVHVVLEEAPAREPSGPSRPWQVLVLSARTPSALEAAAGRLAEHLRDRGSEDDLTDVAYTLALGRRAFEYRRAVVVDAGASPRRAAEAVAAPRKRVTARVTGARPVFFLFPGQGSQHPGMGRELYREEPVFRRELDRCAELLEGEGVPALLDLLHPARPGAEAEQALRQTAVAQPALFAFCYALARLWTSWGVTPRAMIGHSVGEYVAACLAGVFSLRDALSLVALRGRLVQALPGGGMLAVRLSEAEAASFAERGLDLAAVNGPASCVLAGPEAVLDEVAGELAGRQVAARRLRTSHAFHSAAVEPAMAPFRERLWELELAPPELPFFSNVSGRLVTAAEATDPEYWVGHLRRTVRFGDSLAALGQEAPPEGGVLLEVGPGRVLSGLARRHPALASWTALPSLPGTETAFPWKTLGRLWSAGVSVDWEAYYSAERRCRVLLPTYPFERRRYWIEPATDGSAASPGASPARSSVHARPDAAGPFAAPRSETERAVAGIWEEVLGIETIGAEDDFFDLGGDSLLATQVLSRVGDAFGVELALGHLFEAGTVAGLARIAEEERALRPGGAERIPVLPRRPRDGTFRFPASFAQQRLWFLERLGSQGPRYHLTAAFRLTGRLLPGALERAVAETARRHEALRTTFEEVDGEPWQVIRTAAASRLPVADLGALPPAAREAELRRRARVEHDRPFDLARGPLWRFLLLRLAAEEHLLLVAQHHVVSDGWTFGVLQRELVSHYEAFALGRRPTLPAPQVQYADFAVWQRRRLFSDGDGGPLLDAQLAWWKERLCGAAPLLELPADRPRRPVQRFRGALLPFALDTRLTAALTALGRREDATPAMTLLAAFFVLLYRTSGAEKIVVGTPAAGRLRREVEDLVGFFVNNLALPSDLSERPPFRRLLGRVRETTLAAHLHQDLPFEKLVEELEPARDLSRNPLFQVVFAFQNAPPEKVEVAGLEVRPELAVFPSTRFDLELHLWETPRGLEGFWAWDRDLFDATTVTRLSGRYARLLEEAVRDPEARPDDLGTLSAAERHQLAVEWNDTGSDRDEEASLRTLFEQQVSRTPEAVAVVDVRSFDEVPAAVSYRELARRSLGLSRRLGVGPETPVGLCLDRSADLVTAQLGVLAAGGFYVPLDPRLPAERLAVLLRDARVEVVLTRGGRTDLGAGLRQIDLAEEGDEAASGDPRADPPPVTPDHLAYVMYTSGSTGRPKGVAVPQRAVARLVRGARFMELSPAEVFLQLAPPSFDAATLEIWGPLLHGGRLVIPPAGRLSLAEIARTLERHRVSSLWLTAGLFHLVVDEEPRALSGLRQLLAGGDVLSPSHVRRALAALGAGARLTNGYGPTESTTFTACHSLSAAARLDGPVPIGRPIQRTRVTILDHGGRPAPIGVAGELVIGGAGLARGYHRRSALSAERFVPDPQGVGGRLYRSGDLARRLAGGLLEFLGRVDRQVKVRGFRVEPGEIEAVLAEHPAVREAVVTAPRLEAGERRLVAHVTWNEGGPAGGVEELREALRHKLPDYMVPEAVVALGELPLLPSGKVDRAALGAGAARKAPPGAAARTPAEELLAGIWHEVLPPRGAPPAADEDFFSVGGNSLLAVRVISRIRQRLGVELGIREIFEAPTVAALARRVELARRAAAPPLVRRSAGAVLSFAQERLWFLDQLETRSALYNVAGALELRGGPSVEALRRTFEQILRRHEVLHTRFASDNGKPVPVIGPPTPPGLALIDLWGLPGAENVAESVAESVAENVARRLARREAERAFDLERGPLLRTTLFRLTERRYVLLLVLHHIVADEGSLGVLGREMEAFYAAFSDRARAEEIARLPALAVQYADFAAWQRRLLGGTVLDGQFDYWRAKLAGAPLLELATDRPRPSARRFRGRTRSFRLPARLAESLRGVGHEAGATLFMTLLAAFEVVLHRFSQQEDFTLGTPVANRHHPAVEDLVGFFVNTLVLRAAVARELSFRGLLSRVREDALGAFAHQDLPFEHLVERLGVERDLSRTPLFQVMCTLQTTAAEFRLPGLEVTPLDVETGTSKFDLTLMVNGAAAGLAGRLEYSTELFDAATAGRLVSSFAQVLGRAAEDPGRTVGELALPDAVERHQLLVEWNDTAAPEPRPALLHAGFERQAAATPTATALVAGGERLTYAELGERSARLARHLRDLGVGPEVRVAICVRRTPALVVAILAVLEAGGAYVPLDPEYPAERLAFTLEDARARVLVTEQRFRALLPEHGAAVVELDRSEARSQNPPFLKGGAGGDSPDPTSSSLAYVLYTSGSTGRPKGVAVSHKSAASLVDWALRAYAPAELAGTLFSTSICFDLSIFELFATLAAGGTVVLAEEALELPSLAADVPLTLVNTVPSVLAELLRLGAVPATVSTINLAGETLTRDLAEKAYRNTRIESLWNLYGPSESTTYSTAERVAPRESGAPAIGRPIPQTRAWVADRRGRPVPLGVPGELVLAGDGLARGYLGRPAGTAEGFRPDPRSPRPGGRLYPTGDLARRRPDGRLEFLGRLDHQVKVRGFRVEPGEIEAVLERHPGVSSACVVTGGPSPAGRQLVAYTVLAEGGNASPRELREHLAAALPAYMVPAFIVALDELPRLPNGKIDRRRLEDTTLRTEPAPPVEERQAPRSPAAELLAGTWSELLGLAREVAEDDDFFALGGHSLLATQLVSRIRRLFGVELAVRDVFEAPTLAALTGRVEATLRGGAAGSGRPAPPPLTALAHDGSPLPLSFAQQRLWLLDCLVPGSPAYNMPVAVRLRGGLDRLALERALDEIVRRHQVLRTTFTLADGEPVQKIRPPARRALPVADLTALPAAAREAETRRRARLDAARPFDLERGPLLRSSLLALGGGVDVLLVNQHHIVSDGWSLDVFRNELEALYAAFARGEPSPLPELALQYADFAVWQRGWLAGEVLAAELAWWKQQLGAEPPVLELATDRRRPAVQTFRGGAWREDLPAPLHAALRACGRREGASLTMMLMAGLFVLLHRVTGQRRILVGSPIANRGRQEVEGLIGFFVNTVALTGDLAPEPDGREPSFREFLGRVRETCLGAYTHQDLPFEKLVEELALERDLSRNPLLQVTLTVQDAPGSAWRLPGLDAEPLEHDVRSTHFDLEVHLWPRDDGRLGTAFVFDRQLFDPTTAGRLLRRFRRLLEAAVADPGRRLGELAWLGAAERHQALSEWSAGSAPRPAAGLALDRFLKRAAAGPEAPAVCCAPASGEPVQTLSYGELRRRSARLAGRLRRLGVGRESVVGIFCGRSPEMILAHLAVLEAGGAFLPLDPGVPRARLEWMLSDSGAALVLVSRGLADRLGTPPGVRRLILGPEPEGPAAAPAGAPADPEDLAYVIYTSGSTGRPKGVEVTHRGLAHLLDWHQAAYDVTPADRATLTSAVGFDASVWESWPYLAAGASLHVLPEGEHLAPAEHLAWLAEHRVTLSFVATPLLRGWPAADPPDGLRLRALLTGGDVLPPLERELAFALYNHYGPTENTVVATSTPVGASGPGGENPPIGRPIGRVRVHVVGRGSRPLPAGVHGELCLGGESLARGYRNRPALTAERFVPDPFPTTAAPGGRLYRTGDRVRFLADGRLDFAGRLDHQVKVRGIRVELGEIEGVLTSNPTVREAVVLLAAGGNGSGEARLLGCVVPAVDPAADLAVRLRADLERELPPAMVPAHLLVLESLPRTPSGKVDRGALARQTAAAVGERPQLANAFEAPGSEMEELVAGLWREVLGLERVGVHDNFFEVGGHSLAMVQIRERLRRESARWSAPEPPSLVEMFQHPTVYRLARHLSAGRPGVAESQAVAQERAARQGQERKHARARLASQLERRRRTPVGR